MGGCTLRAATASRLTCAQSHRRSRRPSSRKVRMRTLTQPLTSARPARVCGHTVTQRRWCHATRGPSPLSVQATFSFSRKWRPASRCPTIPSATLWLPPPASRCRAKFGESTHACGWWCECVGARGRGRGEGLVSALGFSGAERRRGLRVPAHTTGTKRLGASCLYRVRSACQRTSQPP